MLSFLPEKASTYLLFEVALGVTLLQSLMSSCFATGGFFVLTALWKLRALWFSILSFRETPEIADLDLLSFSFCTSFTSFLLRLYLGSSLIAVLKNPPLIPWAGFGGAADLTCLTALSLRMVSLSFTFNSHVMRLTSCSLIWVIG